MIEVYRCHTRFGSYTVKHHAPAFAAQQCALLAAQDTDDYPLRVSVIGGNGKPCGEYEVDITAKRVGEERCSDE